MNGAFLWVAREADDLIRTLEDPTDRKVVRLFVWAVAAMASRSFDGKHQGFETTVDAVIAEMDVSRPTYRKARKLAEDLGLVVVRPILDGRGRTVGSRWAVGPVDPRQDEIAEDSAEGGKDFSESGKKIAPPNAGAGDGVKKKKPLPSEESPDEVRQIIDYWRERMPGRLSARITAKRRTVVAARLKEFSGDDLRRVIDFIVADPFWHGKNDRGGVYNDLTTIFRSTDKVENHLLNAERKASGAAEQGQKEAVQEKKPPVAAAKEDRAARRLAAMRRLAGDNEQQSATNVQAIEGTAVNVDDR